MTNSVLSKCFTVVILLELVLVKFENFYFLIVSKNNNRWLNGHAKRFNCWLEAGHGGLPKMVMTNDRLV